MDRVILCQVVTLESFSGRGMPCEMWDLSSHPGTGPMLPALEAWSEPGRSQGFYSPNDGYATQTCRISSFNSWSLSPRNCRTDNCGFVNAPTKNAGELASVCFPQWWGKIAVRLKHTHDWECCWFKSIFKISLPCFHVCLPLVNDVLWGKKNLQLSSANRGPTP